MWQYSSKGDAKLFGAGSTYIDLNHIYTDFAPTVAVKPPIVSPQTNYIVKSGDNLTAIARVHGISLQSLISANPQITNPNLIRVGQAIIIPISNATPEPQPPVTPTYTIGVGSIVKLKQGAKTYDGKSLASFVYTRNHVIKQISGDRVVITYSGTVVAAVKINDLILQ